MIKFSILPFLVLGMLAMSGRAQPGSPPVSTDLGPASSIQLSDQPAATASTDVTKMGVVGDGQTLNTAAIQKLIDDSSGRGGGTLRFPAGNFLTGTIQIKDNVTLQLEKDAVLLGSTHAADYRNLDPFKDGLGADMGYALVVSVGARNVGIVGEGTINGQGKAVKAAQNPYTIRPFLVRWVKCDGVKVSDVHLLNSGAWTMNFFQSKNATVERVKIRSLDLANNDGIDLDSCETVRIRDCEINTGDDAICLKATSPQPCRDIEATGCLLQTHCNAIKLGTESLGDFTNIRISNCRLRDIGMSGIALYTVDGSHLTDVSISDIKMERVTVPISIRLGARLKVFRTGDQAKTAGILRNVAIKNVTATGARQIGILVNGIPGHRVENLTLENVQLELPGGGTAADAAIQFPEKESAYPEMSMFGRKMPASGIYIRHAKGVTFNNVKTTVTRADERPPVVLIDAEDVSPADFSPTPAAPAK